MSHWSDDTIAAIATPPGESSVCVVRMSGINAFQVADHVFRGFSIPSECATHTIHYGHIVDPDTNTTIDEVMLSVFKAPRTFTSEDVVEISGHGGYRPGSLILNTLIQHGARLALPGEFTKRAFLKGRIDLIQAEAVAEIIRSRTDASVRTALRQLDGKFSNSIANIRHRIIDLLALVEVGLDFTEEGIDEIEYKHLKSLAESIFNNLLTIKEESQRWRILREGARIAIAGRPNAGKSSLLNQLVEHNRAIVDPTPGTTRDTLEELIDLNGIPVTLVDTAGIRESNNSIESQGVDRARVEIKQADFFLLVLDGSASLHSDDISLSNNLDPIRTIGVINKIDRSQHIDVSALPFVPQTSWVHISALNGVGLNDLKDTLFNLLSGNHSVYESDVLLNERHNEHLESALQSIQQSILMFESGYGQEVISIELRDALKKLGEILGLEISDEILDRIFSSFCIGK